MTKLGEILIARGALTPDELRSALEACRRGGGRLGTWVVRLGYASERALIAALAEQTGCPPATALDLTSASPEVRALIPEAYSRRHVVLAFARHGRNLSVAMVRPNDLVLIDELTAMTGLVIQPHVASEAAFAAALALPGPAADAAPRERDAAPDWEGFWRRRHPARDLFLALEGTRLPSPPAARSSFPTLTPLANGALRSAADGPDRLAVALRGATHRDHVAEAVLDAVGGLADRAALFSVHHGKAMGWAWRGDGVVPEDFHNLILPLDRPSVLLNLAQGVELHSGTIGDMEGNTPLLEALGSPPPQEAVVAPIKVRGRLAAFLWLDRDGRPAGSIPSTTVQEIARLAGMALEILVLRQKIKPPSHLTEWAAAD